MLRRKEKAIRQRRPEIFLYWLRRHWVDDRNQMLVVLSGHRESGRPRATRWNALVALAAVELVTLHMVDGRVIQINPKQVVQLVSGHQDGKPNKTLVDTVNCVIRFTDGTYTSVAETCDAVRALMGETP
jgi:hypothetical protein